MSEVSHRPNGALGVWRAGFGIGARVLRKELVLGLKRLALPVSYWRAAEFAYVSRQLTIPLGARVLDVGSPKDLAAIFARERGFEVVATDILPAAIALSRRYSTAQGLDGAGAGRVVSEIQDGRALSYSDNSFDAAFSVSVLEHIPNDGDTLAIRELVRVVKPGGLVVVTTPYDLRYRETFVDGSVYERQQEAREPVFFERHYDEVTLQERLLTPSGADLLDLQLWGEGSVRVEGILSNLGPVRLPVSPFEAMLSAMFLRRVHPGNGGHAMAAFFTLRKPLARNDA
jgi:SAM-dependent methyltransferase